MAVGISPGELRELNDDEAAIAGYRQAFAEAFPAAPPGQAITRPNLEAALATFERTITAGPSPFDRWIAGDDSAISAISPAPPPTT